MLDLILKKLHDLKGSGDEEERLMKVASSEIEMSSYEDAERHFDSLYVINPDNYLYAYLRGFCKIFSIKRLEVVESFYKLSKLSYFTFCKLLESDEEDRQKIELCFEIVDALGVVYQTIFDNFDKNDVLSEVGDAMSITSNFFEQFTLENRLSKYISKEYWYKLNDMIFDYIKIRIIDNKPVRFFMPNARFTPICTTFLQKLDSKKAKNYLEELERERINNLKKENKCIFCGGDFTGLFTKKCKKCGMPKNY